MINGDKHIEEFKDYWNKYYSWISLELSDEQILTFINRAPNISSAVDLAVDYSLANGLGEVQP